jgi:hypothetical protein
MSTLGAWRQPVPEGVAREGEPPAQAQGCSVRGREDRTSHGRLTEVRTADPGRHDVLLVDGRPGTIVSAGTLEHPPPKSGGHGDGTPPPPTRPAGRLPARTTGRLAAPAPSPRGQLPMIGLVERSTRRSCRAAFLIPVVPAPQAGADAAVSGLRPGDRGTPGCRLQPSRYPPLGRGTCCTCRASPRWCTRWKAGPPSSRERQASRCVPAPAPGFFLAAMAVCAHRLLRAL